MMCITNLLTPCMELDRVEMKVFIDWIRKIANDSIDKGTALDSIDWRV